MRRASFQSSRGNDSGGNSDAVTESVHRVAKCRAWRRRCALLGNRLLCDSFTLPEASGKMFAGRTMVRRSTARRPFRCLTSVDDSGRTSVLRGAGGCRSSTRASFAGRRSPMETERQWPWAPPACPIIGMVPIRMLLSRCGLYRLDPRVLAASVRRTSWRRARTHRCDQLGAWPCATCA